MGAELGKQMGAAVRAIRQQRRLTQRELADLAGVSVRTIARWESGEAMPNAEQMAAMSFPPSLIKRVLAATLLPPPGSLASDSRLSSIATGLGVGAAAGAALGPVGAAAGGSVGALLGAIGASAAAWLVSETGERARKKMNRGMIAGALNAVLDDLKVEEPEFKIALLRLFELMRMHNISLSELIEFLEESDE